MRYDGLLFERIKCHKFRKSLEIPVLFSFKAEKVSDSELRAHSFLPPGIWKFLKNRELFVFEPSDRGKLNILKAYSKEVTEDSCLVVLDGRVSKDRRLFERFAFCPEKMGKFVLRTESGEVGEVYVIDMSLKGIKLLIKGYKRNAIARNSYVTLVQNEKVLIVKVLWEEESVDGLILGCEIQKTNFNVMKFIMSNYVKLIKELLFQNT